MNKRMRNSVGRIKFDYHFSPKPPKGGVPINFKKLDGGLEVNRKII